MIIQCARTKRRRKDSEDDSNETDTDIPEVDLYHLQVNTLRRYKRHYKVPTRPGLNKAQLADVSYIIIWISWITSLTFVLAEFDEAFQNYPSERERCADIFYLYCEN